jgi:hypothetical protein
VAVGAQDRLSDSEREWLAVRDYSRAHHHELAVRAAGEFPGVDEVAGTPLLAVREWVPDRPLPLGSVALDLVPDAAFVDHAGLSAAAEANLPLRADGSRHNSYAETVRALTNPSLFENRTTYRLLEASLATRQPYLRFGLGRYFDGANVGEAAAHEFAARHMGLRPVGRLRETIGNPCDPTRRPVNVAISTVTIRLDRASKQGTFLLHWRDPGRVQHAGGLLQVVPVGIFQPSGEAAWNRLNDFSVWRNIVRELFEELLGASEEYDSERAPIDYGGWEFAARLSAALDDASVNAYCLGLGVDPLTFATDLLTAVVIDAPVFDTIFGEVVTDNAEGRVVAGKAFTAAVVEELVSDEPIQAAGAALLRLAIDGALVH